MNKIEILKALDANKDKRGMRIWEKAGIKNMSSFGLGVTKLKALAKKIGKDHDLALELWSESNFDCKVLSTLIDEPKKLSTNQIEEQVNDVGFWMLSHAYCNYLLPKYPEVIGLAENWKSSKDSLRRRCGFQLYYQIAKNNKKLDDSYFIPLIELIENELQSEENFVKDAMNNALWAIGLRNPALNKRCIETADRIGKVKVDYGDNSCEAIDVTKHLTSEQTQKRFKSN